jgi:nitrogen fixation/metabolism regulation signal transduction histidine kinase
MEPKSILDQIERMKRQNRTETDPVMKKENNKTIRHLHKQYRKATQHRHPWFGFVPITVVLLVVFLLTVWVYLAFIKVHGWTSTAEASSIVFIVFVLITATILLLLKAITPEIYKAIVQQCLGAFASLPGGLTHDPVPAPIPEKRKLERNKKGKK